MNASSGPRHPDVRLEQSYILTVQTPVSYRSRRRLKLVTEFEGARLCFNMPRWQDFRDSCYDPPRAAHHVPLAIAARPVATPLAKMMEACAAGQGAAFR